MKTRNLFISIVFLFTFFTGSVSAQYYTNVLTHFQASTTHGVKIKTQLPYSSASAIPTVKIEGNDYGKLSGEMLLSLTISWYAHEAGAPYKPVVVSSGSSIPDVYLANEGGFATIYLDERIGLQRFNVSVAFPMFPNGEKYLTGWTVVDEPLPANATKIPYGNNFGGKVGINTEKPKTELDVNGVITSKGLQVESGDLSVSGASSLSGNLLVRGDINLAATKTFYSYNGSFTHNDKSMSHYGFKWEKDSRDNSGYSFWLGGYAGIKFFTGGGSRMVISHSGNVGIGVETPQNKLEVNGIIRAKGVKMEASGWADFVFNKDYRLPSLSEVESHIQENKHLPGIPSEQEVLKEGIDLADMQAKLLQKIEELTLYAIEQNKRLQEQETLIKQLQEEMLNKKQ